MQYKDILNPKNDVFRPTKLNLLTFKILQPRDHKTTSLRPKKEAIVEISKFLIWAEV